MASGDQGSVVGSVGRLFHAGAVGAQGEAQWLERFVSRGDEAAFEAILRRHGPMVLGVCRRVLDDPHDVDDAFQATFLVLVRKARSIRGRDVLGPWLHGVARRVAVRAKVNARRRRGRERTAVEGAGADAGACRADPVEAGELRALIDDELGRLPGRYRDPLVLCDLEGRTHEEAAEQLRCPVGTVKSRLSRGRERLRSGLARRGVAPSSALLASALAAGTAEAVTPRLTTLTIGTAANVAAGRACPAGIGALVNGVIRSMTLSKLKLAAGAAVAVALAATAGVRAIDSRRPAAPARGPEILVPTQASKVPPRPPAAAEVDAAEGRGQGQDPATVRFRLANGLKVFVRPIRGAKHTALVVLFGIGEDHDPAGRAGLGHLVEHLYVTAPAGGARGRTAQEFFGRYPEGANGQTGARYTVVATSFPAAELGAELKDAAARMGDLRIGAADVERERGRLVQEVENMFARFPALAALNNARELVRPAPNGGRHGGRPEQVRAITPEEAQAHWGRYYKPRNAILAIAGDVEPGAARKAVEEHFARLPAGEAPPTPGAPGAPKFGAANELTVASPLPGARPAACLAYPAPSPDSDAYAPFLVLVTRLWAGMAKLGGAGASGPPVYFTPLDDGTVVAVSAEAGRGEPAARAFARLEEFVAGATAPKLRDGEARAVRQQLGFFFGMGRPLDLMLAQNPYGVAFSIGRREQLGIDPARLERALDAVTERDLRRAAEAIFAPGRHAGALIAPRG